MTDTANVAPDAPTPPLGTQLPTLLTPDAPAAPATAPLILTPALVTPGVSIVPGRKGHYRLSVSKAWGSHFEACENPALPDVDTEAFQLTADFPKIPASYWYAYVGLAFHYLKPSGKGDQPDSTSEMSVIIARSRSNPAIWRLFAPRQTVGRASVDADLTQLIDILTGEELPGLPEDLAHVGSSHSHNDMGAFFSGTDDRNELTLPGVHIVIGRLEKKEAGRASYVPLASIVRNKKRYMVDFGDVVDARPALGRPYHPKCISYITKYVYRSSYGLGFNARDYSSTGVWTKDEVDAWLAEWRKKNGREDPADADAKKIKDIQAWLNEPGARLDKQGAKKDAAKDKHSKIRMSEDTALPIDLREVIMDARIGAAKLAHAESNAVRAFCNAIERSARSPDAMLLIQMVANELAMCSLNDVAMPDEDDGLPDGQLFDGPPHAWGD